MALEDTLRILSEQRRQVGEHAVEYGEEQEEDSRETEMMLFRSKLGMVAMLLQMILNGEDY